LPQTPNANSRRKSKKITVALWESTMPPRQKQKGRNQPRLHCSWRAKSPTQAFTVSAGEGEEERRGWDWVDIELCLAAPLLESVGRSPLSRSHTCFSARPFALSVEQLLHLHLGSLLLMSAFSSPCHYWPSAPTASYHRPSAVQLRVAITVRRSARFKSPSPSVGLSALSLSIHFESVRTYTSPASSRALAHQICRFSHLFAPPLLI